MTYLVINKSDRTRLLPANKRDPAVSHNVLPGTLVDHTITMYRGEVGEGAGEGASQYDFYLNSQAGLKVRGRWQGEGAGGRGKGEREGGRGRGAGGKSGTGAGIQKLWIGLYSSTQLRNQNQQ